jgi:hypothetical protein
MTNTFIPTLRRNPLYCVWIETGNPARPLDCVWIDPELRSFVDVETAAPIHATNDECEPEALAGALPPEGLVAGQLSIFAVRREEMKVKAGSVMKRLLWVVVVLCFLLNIAWADVAGRISGIISDPSGAFVAGAPLSLSRTWATGSKRQQPPTTRGNIRSQLFPLGTTNLRSILPASSHIRR